MANVNLYLVTAVFLYLSFSLTLGARGFQCAVSGFGQVLKSDPRVFSRCFAARVFGRTFVGLWPTKQSSLTHARKNLLYPG